MKISLWLLQIRFFLEFLLKQALVTVFSIHQANSFLRQFQKRKIEYPLFHEAEDPIKEYLYLLSRVGILKQINETEFRIISSPHDYKYIEAALDGDNEVLYKIMYT